MDIFLYRKLICRNRCAVCRKSVKIVAQLDPFPSASALLQPPKESVRRPYNPNQPPPRRRQRVRNNGRRRNAL